MLQITQAFKIAYKSLIANVRRTILTMVGITIGVACVVLIMALGNGIKQKTISQFKLTNSGKPQYIINFVPNNQKDTTSGFNQDDIQLLKDKNSNNIENVKITTQNEFNTQVSTTTDNMFNASVYLVNNQDDVPKVISGKKILSFNSMKRAENTILMSSDKAKSIFGSEKGAIDSSVIINNHSFLIIGIFKRDPNATSIYGSEILIPKKVYKHLILGTSGNQLEIVFNDFKNSNKKIKQVRNLLKKRGSSKNLGDYIYVDQQEIQNSISTVVNAITIFIAAVAGISLFIAGIGVMNMMYVTVTERIEEIGIRLAVGALRNDIKIQFIIESLLVTLIGGIAGFILGVILSLLVSIFIPFQAIITFSSFIVSMLISVLVGVIFGSVPAIRASKQNLADIFHQ